MEMFSVTSTTGVLATLSAVCAFFFWLEKKTDWRFFQLAPPLIFIYLVPMILSTEGILPHKSPVYDAMQTFLLPMLLILILIKMNVRGAVRILGPGLGVMLVGALGVMVGAPIGLLIVRPWLGPDAWKAFGALAASWVGGTANLAAVAEMLHSHGIESLSMLADSTITYLIWLPLLLASKRYAEPFARFAGVDTAEVTRLENEAETHFEEKTAPSTTDYLFLLSVALVATWIADSTSKRIEERASVWFPPTVIAKSDSDSATATMPPATTSPQATSQAATNETAASASSQPAEPKAPAPPDVEKSPFADAATWRILLITTIGIGLSFTNLNRIAGSQELAMALLYLFVSRMGATADLKPVAGQAVPFLVAALIWIFIHGAFCLLGAKLFRTDIHIAAIASAANIGGVATATIVATYHKRSLLPAAILMAIIGYAIGTYCGYITAIVCKMLM